MIRSWELCRFLIHGFSRSFASAGLILCLAFDADGAEPPAKGRKADASELLRLLGATPTTRSGLQAPMFGNGFTWPATSLHGAGSQHASMVIQVDSDSDRGYYPPQATSILTSSTFMEQVVKETFKEEADKARSAVQLTASDNNRFTRLDVVLIPNKGITWKDGDAQRLILAVKENLQRAFDESADAANASANSSKENWEQSVAAVNAKLEKVREEKRQIRDLWQQIPANCRQTGDAVRSVEQYLASTEAQAQGYREQLVNLGPPPEADALVKNWQQVIESRAEKLATLKTQKAPDGDIKEAELAMKEALASAALAQRSEVSNPNPFAAKEYARTKNKLDMIEKQCEEYRTALKKLSTPEFDSLPERQQRAEADERVFRQELSLLYGNRDQMASQARQAGRFRVTILDGLPDVAPEPTPRAP